MNIMLSKIWMFAVVVIFIIVGIFAWLYFSNTEENILEQATQSEVADWLVYKNQDFQFELKHPDSWAAVESYADDHRGICFITESDPRKCMGRLIISWDINWEERYLSAKEEYQKNSDVIESIIYVDGIEAKALDIKTSNESIKLVVFERGQYVYTYAIDTTERSPLEKILSTLKFTEPTYIEQIKILSPRKGEEWYIGEENSIVLDKPLRDYNPFAFIVLVGIDGTGGGVLKCRIGGTETTVYKWDTKDIFNICSVLPDWAERFRQVEPGIFKIVIEENDINIAESELFSISASGEAAYPFISYIIPSRASLGAAVEIQGSGLAGFEGDLQAYFEREDGKKILLTDTFGSLTESQDKLIKIELKEPCQEGETVYGPYSGIPSQCDYIELTPGVYKVYVEAWGKTSNTVSFTVTP